MSPLGGLFLAFPVADLVSGGLSGTPASLSRAAVGFVMGSVAGLAWILMAAAAFLPAVAWVAIIMVCCAGWIFPRIGE